MIEINGTYYAKDCIKSIGMVVEKMKPNGQWIYQFEITLHVVNRGIIEGVIKTTKTYLFTLIYNLNHSATPQA